MTTSSTGMEVTKTLYTPEDIAKNADFWEIGWDPGSGFSIAYGTPVKLRTEGRQDLQERGNTYRIMIPSLVGNTSLRDLARARGLEEGAAPGSVLEQDEYIIRRTESKSDKVVGHWAEIEGKGTTAAKGLSERYWGEHGLDLLLTVLSIITKSSRIRVRLITGLPWSLFEVPGNRKRVSDALEKVHHYTFNGQEVEAGILVGAVVAEGYAPIAYADEINGDQVSLDIGERTVNAIYAHNMTLLHDRCRSEEYGIGLINEGIIQQIKRDYHKEIKLSVVRDYLTKFTAGSYLPPLKTPVKTLEHRDLYAIFEEHINREWLPIQTMLGAMLNAEGAEVASNIERLLLMGGGAAIYQHKVQSYLPRTSIVLEEDSQDKNARYYHDLCRTIERNKPAAWKR